MAVNSTLNLPPLQSLPFVDPATGNLSRLGVSALQSMVNAITALQGAFPSSTSASYTDDAAAAAGGVPINGFYRNGSQVMVRVS